MRKALPEKLERLVRAAFRVVDRERHVDKPRGTVASVTMSNHRIVQIADELAAIQRARQSRKGMKRRSTLPPGVKGGRARAKALTPERRSEIARKASEARWLSFMSAFTKS